MIVLVLFFMRFKELQLLGDVQHMVVIGFIFGFCYIFCCLYEGMLQLVGCRFACFVTAPTM